MNGKNTAHFDQVQITLKRAFCVKTMIGAWNKFVKVGLREQEIIDLYDYYEFHSNLRKNIDAIIKQIIEGHYQTKPLHMIRIEKKHGVCRHMLIPSPEDALVLQTIVENLLPFIKKSKPTQRAFYSRSHGMPRAKEDIDESFSYNWWELWPEFQKHIYSFTKTYRYVVITDIANYFDSISFQQLRNKLSEITAFDKGLLDFLFFMIESMAWHPDYSSRSILGIPQINFDAPRLLGFSFLFEVDSFLNRETNGDFVRWMDDIDFGVDKVAKGKQILQDLDEILLSHGVRINMGKTKILSSKDAKFYFLPDENRVLSIYYDRIKRLLESGMSVEKEKEKIKVRFKGFLKKPDVGRWEKAYARYFTIASLLKDGFLSKYVPDLIADKPGLRKSIFKYYTKLGVSERRFQQLKEFYISEHNMDDSSVFGIAKVFTDWKIRPNNKICSQIVSIAILTSKNSTTYFISSLWMLAKYGSAKELFAIIIQECDQWKYSNFASRQVAAVLPCLKFHTKEYQQIIDLLLMFGQFDAYRIVLHSEQMRRKKILTKVEQLYYLNGTKKLRNYPLSKFLMLYGLLADCNLDEKFKREFLKSVLERIDDIVYKKKLKSL